MSTHIKRLRKEEEELRRNPDNDLRLFPLKDTLTRWKAFISGPSDTPFQGYVFELEIEISSMYPMEPPRIKFITKIFHPNIHFKDGTICMDILKRDWSPAWTLRSACIAIVSLLGDPEADSPLNCDAGNMIRANDMMAYEAMAKMYCIEYASRKLPEY